MADRNIESLTLATTPTTEDLFHFRRPSTELDYRTTWPNLFGATTPITEITIAAEGLHLASAGAGDLIVKPGSTLTADRILTLTTGDAARTLTLTGDATLNQAVDTTASPTFADLTLTGGDLICSTATTFNLVNTVATTVNAFGAATTINLGSSVLTTLALPSGGTYKMGSGSYYSSIAYNPGASSTLQFTLNHGDSAVNMLFTINSVDVFRIARPDIASAVDSTLRRIYVLSQTVTISGSTNITTAGGFNFFEIGIPTYSNASIVLTVGATLYIAGPPALSGGMTATDLYALWVDAGITRLDGDVVTGTTTVNLWNTVATTLNIGGAATTIAMGAANAVITLAGGVTINGGSAANDDLTIQGTSNATRTTSYVLIQPNGGNVGIGKTPTQLLDVNGNVYADKFMSNNIAHYTGYNTDGGQRWDFVMTGTRRWTFADTDGNGVRVAISVASGNFVTQGAMKVGGVWTDTPTGKLDILGTLTVASGASAVLRDFWMEPATVTISGVTNITTATGFNFFEIGIPTYSNASIVLTVGATLYVAGPPTLSGGMTATDLYAVWVDAGITRLDGNGTHVLELPADATGNATGATGRVPIKIGVGTKYLRYFDD